MLDIILSWETGVVVLGFVVISIFFILSKKKYKKDTSTPGTAIYSDFYGVSEMFKQGVINEEEYKKAKQFVSKATSDAIKKEEVQKTIIAEETTAKVPEIPILDKEVIEDMTKQKPVTKSAKLKEIIIPQQIQQLINEKLITKAEYLDKVKSLR